MSKPSLPTVLAAAICLTAVSCQSKGAKDDFRHSVLQETSSSKMSYWLDAPRRGANFFNNVELKEEKFEAAKAAGIEVVRLAPNKWLNGRPKSELGDFLLGPSSSYSGLIQDDLAYLKLKLDEVHQAGIRVVLTTLSLPGHRWSQHNAGVQERRLWQELSAWEDAIAFWRDLAQALKDHPAVVGYNILNEPSPERVPPVLGDWYTGDYQAWYNSVRGTAADLNLFYGRVVEAIREVDPNTPVILDAGFYATPWAFKVLEPVADQNVLYAFHLYEPYRFASNENDGQYAYPGAVPVGETEDAPLVQWNRQELADFLAPVREWQAQHEIPAKRIFASEFGAFRYNSGVEAYLRDVIDIYNEERWHWAFYSFREDDWEGMDYELGTAPPPAKYWEHIEQGTLPGGDVYTGSAMFDVVRNGLAAP